MHPVLITTFMLRYALLAQPVLYRSIVQQNFRCIIVDESHYLKNRRAKRTEAVLPLLHQAKRLVLLSGTPALGRPEELFTQVFSLCPFLLWFFFI